MERGKERLVMLHWAESGRENPFDSDLMILFGVWRRGYISSRYYCI